MPAAVLLVLAIGSASVAVASSRETVLISRGMQGPALTDAFGESPSMSADGRYIAFVSNAINFGNEARGYQIWVRDRLTGEIRLASRSTNGEPARGGLDYLCQSPSISADGRFVAFTTAAQNLVPDNPDGLTHVYVHDFETGVTERVDPTVDGGPANQHSDGPAVSADGRFVAFTSASTNIVSDDTNGHADVFVRDRLLRRTERVSVATDGSQGNGESGREYGLAISGDGRYVGFGSTANNLGSGAASSENILVRDREAGATELVSIGSFGGPVSARHPSISSDGRFVAFTSGASYVLVRDRVARTTETASIGPNGTALGPGVEPATISADGRFVAFGADASYTRVGIYGDVTTTQEVFVRDRSLATTERVSVPPAGGSSSIGAYEPEAPGVSADGRFIAFTSDATNLVPGDTNGLRDVFLCDRQSGTLIRADLTPAGEPGIAFAHSSKPSVSADGRFVAFISDATNLVPGDTNARSDVFVYDRSSGTMERANIPSTGGESRGPGGATTVSISADGRYVAFVSEANDLVPNDGNIFADAFVRDRLLGTTERVSLKATGQEGSLGVIWMHTPSITPDGRYVAFVSYSNLLPGDNGLTHVYVRDRQLGTTQRASSTWNGAAPNAQVHPLQQPQISADGRFVAFISYASNMVLNDTNGVLDVFVRDRQAGTTERINVSSSGQQASASAWDPAMSYDGRFVAFASSASNLVPNDTNNNLDVFVRDRSSGATERVSVSSAGAQASYWSTSPSISADGRFVVFDSPSPDLVPGDTNGAVDVFVHDRVTRKTDRVSVASGGGESYGGWSREAAITADGSAVAYTSSATDLTTDKLSGADNVFLTTPASGPDAGYSVQASAESIETGGALTATWTAPSSAAGFDWIGLFRVGDPNTGEVWWNFTGGAATGSVNLQAPNTPGTYELRYFYNNTRIRLAQSRPITVTAPPASGYTLAVSTTNVAPGGTLSVSWTAPAGAAYWDWVGLFRVDDPNSGELWYRYTGGAASGTVDLQAPSSPGTYEFRYLPNNGRLDVARSAPVTVTGPASSGYTLTPSSTNPTAGGPLSVAWIAPAGAANFDWIGLFRVGDPNTGELWWNYTWGAPSGSFSLTAPAVPGTYEFRYLLNNGRSDVQRSSPITVP